MCLHLHIGGSGLSTAFSLLIRPVPSLATARLEPDNRNNSYLYPRTRNVVAASFDFLLAAFTMLLAVFIPDDLTTVSSIPCIVVMAVTFLGRSCAYIHRRG